MPSGVTAQSDESTPHELVDDAASSVCIDAEDYVELDNAIKTLQDQPDPRTDFEKYNHMTARRMVENQRDTNVIDLDSLNQSSAHFDHVKDKSPYIKYDDFKIMMLGGCASIISLYEMADTLTRDGPVGMIIGSCLGLAFYFLAFDAPTEMMAFHPLGGYGAYVAQYVNESLGFALDCVYWFSCIASAGQELIAALLSFTQFRHLNTTDDNYVIWLIYLFALMIGLQLLSKPARMALITIVSFLSVCIYCVIIIMRLLVTTGRLPPHYRYVAYKYWHQGCGGLLQDIYCGKFQAKFGKLTGSLGRFMMVLDAFICAFRVASTTDKLYTFVAKLRNPRKSLAKTVKYRIARLLLILLIPTICVAIGTAANDPLLNKGKAVTNFTDEPISDPSSPTETDPNIRNLECHVVSLSRWEHFSGIRTFLPLSVPFIRAGVCKMTPFLAASSIFLGLNSCFWYLTAASETLDALAMQRPFKKLIKGKWKYKYIAIRTFNVVILVNHTVWCWYGYTAFYQFMAVARDSYVFLLMGLLNVASIRFYRGVRLQNTDGFLDRNDEDWPYYSYTGLYGAYICSVLCACFWVVHFPVGATSLQAWHPSYGNATLIGLEISIPITVIHWLVYRCPIVDIRDINIAGVKRSLDEQEWAEDRVFRRRSWAAVYLWARRIKQGVKRVVTAPVRGNKQKET